MLNEEELEELRLALEQCQRQQGGTSDFLPCVADHLSISPNGLGVAHADIEHGIAVCG
jgi:hypothetical protein